MRNKAIKRIVLIFIGLTGLILQSVAQQNIQFTQYVFNALSVNPAYAGYKEAWYLQATQRMQWIGLAGAPRTSQVSIDGVTDNAAKKTGLGLQLTIDELGAQSATSLYVNYAYRLQINNDDTRRLCFGLAAGVTQYGIDGTILEPVNEDDPALTSDYKYNYIPDIRFGVYYNCPKWYIGLSILDMLSGEKSNSIFNWDIDSTQNIMRKRHSYLIAGTIFDFSKDIKFRPGILIKSDFKGPVSWDLNALFIFENHFLVGGSYRTAAPSLKMSLAEEPSLSKRNSVSGIVQFHVTDALSIGYSYDCTISKLSSVENGTHELTLGWTFNRKYQRVLSPRFF